MLSSVCFCHRARFQHGPLETALRGKPVDTGGFVSQALLNWRHDHQRVKHKPTCLTSLATHARPTPHRTLHAELTRSAKTLMLQLTKSIGARKELRLQNQEYRALIARNAASRAILSKHEARWRGKQPFLHSKGYMLRPRYHPDWLPSWNRPENAHLYPRTFEDYISSPVRMQAVAPLL